MLDVATALSVTHGEVLEEAQDLNVLHVELAAVGGVGAEDAPQVAGQERLGQARDVHEHANELLVVQ
eukprot:10042870-Alexandrium_andersonii.AAC.1